MNSILKNASIRSYASLLSIIYLFSLPALNDIRQPFQAEGGRALTHQEWRRSSEPGLWVTQGPA